MPLTEEELEAQLAEIRKKREQEEGKGRGESVQFVVDLSDPQAVSRAKKAGWLPEDFDADEEQDDGEEDGEEKDEAPKRGRRASLRSGYGDE